MIRKNICMVLLLIFMPVNLWAIHSTASFEIWLQKFKRQAVQQGVSSQIVDTALNDAVFLPWVIEADRRQPEFKKSLSDYLAGAVSKKRVEQGRRLLSENRQLLDRIANRFRVQSHYLVALWGIETNFGRNTGKVPILSALATLAYDARRSEYFHRELINTLRILDSGQLKKEQLFGSWAGAMGQLQFMPSTFLGFAVDGNGDGRIDLWKTREDYLSSAANYLHKSGWQWQYRWGREVVIPQSLDSDLTGLEYRAPLSFWQRLGVRLVDRHDLPMAEISASLVLPEGGQGRAFLVYDNYRVIMRWNKAHSFALAVGMLADKIAAGLSD